VARSMRDVIAEKERLTKLEPARRKELDQLQEIEKKSFASRGRFRERPYLQAVYKLYRKWRADRHAPSRAAHMAKLCGISPRKDSHPIKIIIDCTSPKADVKIRSRWALALRNASEQGISSSKLLEFLDQKGKGGLAGRAREFPALQRRKSATPKKKAADSKKKVVISLKNPAK
jgi:hypothetical protein